MWNARLDESQVGVKIARRYQPHSTLMVEGKEELKSLYEGEKESEKGG